MLNWRIEWVGVSGRGLGLKYGKHGSWPKKLISSLFFQCGQGSCLFLLASGLEEFRKQGLRILEIQSSLKHLPTVPECGDTVMWVSLSVLFSCGVYSVLRFPHAYFISCMRVFCLHVSTSGCEGQKREGIRCPGTGLQI